MPKPFTFLFIFFFAMLTISCKNDSQNVIKTDTENKPTQITTAIPGKRAAKKVLTPADIAVIESVMAKVINEQQLKKFASYLVTAQLTNQLSGDEEQFTIFSPSNAAIESLTAEKQKFYSSPENSEKLVEMLKSHIISGKMDKESLLKTISKNGKAKLKTLAGTTITATKVGENIVIFDAKGTKTTVVKGSIDGSNGTIYVVDGVLNVN
jgi:uncharacterized surface protein with fasciclin (FAS1) repeats